jgi:ATP-dependent Lon protease
VRHTGHLSFTVKLERRTMADLRLDFSVPTNLPQTLPLLPLRRGVLLPGMIAPFGIGRERSKAAIKAAMSQDGLILVAAQREAISQPAPSDLLPIAVLARIVQGPLSGGRGPQYLIQGIKRVQLRGFPATHPFIEASFQAIDTQWPSTSEAAGTLAALNDAVSETAALLFERAPKGLLSNLPPSLFIDAVAGLVDAPMPWKHAHLQTIDPLIRAGSVLKQVIAAREAIAARKAISERMEEDVKGMNREALLRRQLKAIREELGEGDSDQIGELRERIEALPLPDEVRKMVNRELDRIDRLSASSPERSVAVDWLEWIAEMPWSVNSAVDVDLNALEDALDRSHYGLEDVKRQVLEHLSVRKLAGKGRADVLLLVGPPGVGKTSIGQAIADATGRKLVRMALGGVRDEAELRGHRRTYIGARPGRLVTGLRKAGTADPVVLLDELDKLGRGWQGDPSAALLEILDPEQNHAFVDHYLEVPFDLSRVLFVATANDLSTIPAPLRDRLEVLNIAGYTPEEKVVIAKNHLLSTLATNAGVSLEDVVLSDEAIRTAINGWTREAGVRQLQRTLGRIFRAVAVKKARGSLEGPLTVTAADLPEYLGRRKFFDASHEAPTRPGIATGLAWTPTGGDVLYVEASTIPGKGQLMLTGQLGDVMKESARAALTYVLSHARALGIPEDALRDRDVHMHVPAGAVPKDGPSAGVTMATALTSLLTNRIIRDDVAMTGEVTLRGRVMPVGGIKDKVLAAHRRGLTRIILPKRNELDLDDLPEEVRKEMEFFPVDHMEEVLAAALTDLPAVDRPLASSGRSGASFIEPAQAKG